MSALYKWINPPVKLLLRSPFHGLMSQNTLLLEFAGRKSDRALSTPISYHIKNGAAFCFTSRTYAWWRNLTNGQQVTLTLAGKKYRSQPQVVTDDHELMVSELDSFLRAVPRDAAHAGVGLDAKGNPIPADIQQVVAGMVFLKFPLQEA